MIKLIHKYFFFCNVEPIREYIRKWLMEFILLLSSSFEGSGIIMEYEKRACICKLINLSGEIYWRSQKNRIVQSSVFSQIMRSFFMHFSIFQAIFYWPQPSFLFRRFWEFLLFSFICKINWKIIDILLATIFFKYWIVMLVLFICSQFSGYIMKRHCRTQKETSRLKRQ